MGEQKDKGETTKLVKPETAADALKMAFSAGKPSKAERIHKELGTYVFLYYRYVDYFNTHPSNLDDMVDGLIYIHFVTERES